MSLKLMRSLRAARISVAFFGAFLCVSANAITVTLPTTNLDATTTFSFSGSSQRLMSLMGIAVTARGNSKQSDPTVWSFDMPVTQIGLNIGLFSLSPESGKANGSALDISGEEGGLQLANFSLDFKRNILLADMITANGTTKNFDVYNFNVEQGLHVSTTGGLSMQMSLTQMKLTTGAQSAFADALALPSFVATSLSKLDFGRLDINISPALRFGVSEKPYMTTMIPELSSPYMLLVGLIGVIAAVRRKNTLQERY